MKSEFVNGMRVCQNQECHELATHAVMWTEGWVYYCEKDARWMVEVGNAMGFGVPANTIRVMTPMEQNINVFVASIGQSLCLVLNSVFSEDFHVAGSSLKGDLIRIAFQSEHGVFTFSVNEGALHATRLDDLAVHLLEAARPYLRSRFEEVILSMSIAQQVMQGQ